MVAGFGASHYPAPSRHINAKEDDKLDRMIGQMIMVGFHGQTTRSPGTRRIVSMLKDGRVGGVILMQRNMSSRQRLLALTRAFNKSGAALPPFISVDQEGGAVQRLRRRQGFSRIPSAGRIASRHKPDAAEKIYDRAADQLKRAGINMNFGPVVDLNRNRNNPIIGRQRRAYGTSPETVTEYARAFISAHRRAGILTAAKHFPGHGSSWNDSHNRFVDLTKTWKDVELAPYRMLSGATEPDMIMVGHLYHPKFSNAKERIPASLSKAAILGELRGRLGYTGIVITDDMEMGAVKRRFSLKERVVRAVEAGNDVILFSDATRNGRKVVDRIHKHVRDAVASGRISRTRIESAYERIVAAKRQLAPKPPAVPHREARADLRLRSFE
ncbi:MAG: glycoside hydrolase family 3 protein [Hyphomicrobiaceae bacterium]